MQRPALYTIGHSTHPIHEFIGLLEAYAIVAVADVRTIPRSRHNPQFNEIELRASLESSHMLYWRLPELGGLRHAKRDSTNLGWTNASFRGYADYMASTEFEDGLQALMIGARELTTAIMCAEAVPWRCHRSLISDALVVRGWSVRDIMSRTSAPPHRLTPFLKVANGKLTYPALGK